MFMEKFVSVLDRFVYGDSAKCYNVGFRGLRIGAYICFHGIYNRKLCRVCNGLDTKTQTWGNPLSFGCQKHKL